MPSTPRASTSSSTVSPTDAANRSAAAHRTPIGSRPRELGFATGFADLFCRAARLGVGRRRGVVPCTYLRDLGQVAPRAVRIAPQWMPWTRGVPRRQRGPLMTSASKTPADTIWNLLRAVAGVYGGGPSTLFRPSGVG